MSNQNDSQKCQFSGADMDIIQNCVSEPKTQHRTFAHVRNIRSTKSILISESETHTGHECIWPDSR